MQSQAILEIEGKKYMSTKTAADCWNLKPKTVAEYCRTDRLIDKIKIENKWYIFIDEMKPLSIGEIRKLLILTVQLKNKPTLEIDWSAFSFDDSKIEIIYKNLALNKYIFPFDIRDKKRIPYEVVLTEKGLDAITNTTKRENKSFSTVLKEWLPIIIQLAQLSLNVYKMCPGA